MHGCKVCRGTGVSKVGTRHPSARTGRASEVERDGSLHLFTLKPTDGCSRLDANAAFLHLIPALPVGTQPLGCFSSPY